jgi:hypothetical protein
MKTIEPTQNTVKVKKVKKKSLARVFWKVTGFFMLFLVICIGRGLGLGKREYDVR